MWNRRHRWIRRLAAGLAFAALVVPTAQAGIVEDSGIGASDGPAAEYTGYGYHHGTGVPVAQQGLVRPDDKAVRFSPQPVDSTLVVRPDDRSNRFSPAGGDAPQLVAQPSSSIDWTDAGIGAGMAVGLMLLGLGAGLATRHLGRKSLASA